MSTNWRVCIRENARAPERGSVWRELADDSGVFIAQTYEPYAEFIVRACNSHDEMVAALENLAFRIRNYTDGAAVCRRELGEADAALAKAKS